MSYRADPVRKVLVKCHDEAWMAGRLGELAEVSHRHPGMWWEQRYSWMNEEGEPRVPDWKQRGKNVYGPEYMMD